MKKLGAYKTFLFLEGSTGLLLPMIFTSNSALTIMNQMWITVVFALAYNMLLGQGGMLSFGHAVYAGVGGFACMHIMNATDFFSAMPLPVLPVRTRATIMPTPAARTEVHRREEVGLDCMARSRAASVVARRTRARSSGVV